MINFSEKIENVKPSATLAITSKAKAMKAKGEDVVIFAAGEPDFDTPEVIKEAAIKAIKDGFTKYTPASGVLSLKEAIVSKLLKDNELDYSTDQIVVSNGAKHSIYNVLQVLLNPLDEVLLISPYWLSYPEMVCLSGAVPKVIKTDIKNDFKLDISDLKSAITNKTRVLIINSPSNPAGIVYEKEELEKIVDICVSNNILIISDEIYEKIIFDGKKHVSIASISKEAYDSTILINGVSKSYSMTGWRIGYMAANEQIIKKVSTLQSHSTSNPCAISQMASCCALSCNSLDDILEKNRQKFQNRRDLLIDMLKTETRIKPIVPKGAFYLFCDISSFGFDSFSFAEKLLVDKKIAVIPGGPFGEDGFIRISFAVDSNTIEKGINRLKDWVRNI